MTTFVYVPFPDNAFDTFVTALVTAKNQQHGAGSYVHIARGAAGGLSVVQPSDRLYIGIHGSRSGRVYTTAADGATPNLVMTGSVLAEVLIERGLPTSKLRLYLWVCKSGAAPADSPNGAWQSLGTNVVTQVASRLKMRGYLNTTVIGYRQDVVLVDNGLPNISVGILQDPHKSLWLSHGDDQPHAEQIPTKWHRMTRRTFWMRGQ